jgi:ligand-binding sensor domain-containing protein
MAVMAASFVPACGDDPTQPDPPPPPPQISTALSLTRSQGLTSNDVFSLLVTSEGELWVGTSAGITMYPTTSSTAPNDTVNELNGLPNPNVRTMVEYDDHIYVATWGGGIGIFDMTADTWSTRTTANGMLAGGVADLAASPTENLVYCATSAGVSILDVGTGDFTSFVPTNLMDPIVSCVALRDDMGTIERWYGPRFEGPVITDAAKAAHGITVSRGASTLYYYTLANSGLAEARVNDIYYDSDDNVFWVAFTSAGLARVDPAMSTWTYYTTEEGLPSNLVYSVTRANGTMWVGTQMGLACLGDNGRWQGYSRSGGLQADRVRTVYSDDGQCLWLGFVDGGAARVNPASAGH